MSDTAITPVTDVNGGLPCLWALSSEKWLATRRPADGAGQREPEAAAALDVRARAMRRASRCWLERPLADRQ